LAKHVVEMWFVEQTDLIVKNSLYQAKEMFVLGWQTNTLS